MRLHLGDVADGEMREVDAVEGVGKFANELHTHIHDQKRYTQLPPVRLICAT